MSTFERYQGNWFEQINNYDSMVTEGKKQQESGRILRYPVDWDDTVSIVSSPWILEVEGIKLYVRKEDNYPVFKRCLNQISRKKHQIEIPLPGEKFKEFEDFLGVSIILISNVLSQVCKAIAQRSFIFKRTRWSLLSYIYPRNALY